MQPVMVVAKTNAVMMITVMEDASAVVGSVVRNVMKMELVVVLILHAGGPVVLMTGVQD